MSIRTKIQWCDSTCNPTMGCDGCELWDKTTKKCYAGVLHTRFGGSTPGYAPTFEEVTLFPGRMEQAAKWSDLRGAERTDKPWLGRMPRLIFVSDMSDALSKDVSFDYLNEDVIKNVASERGSRHQWLWLTKRPARMAKFSQWLTGKKTEWPTNLWVGTSVTSQQMTTRITSLLEVGNEETIHFLSVEPQYEEIDLRKWLPRLHWVIQGGESGHDASAFDISWARSLNSQCRQHNVPYFLKQLGSVVVSKGQRIRFNNGHAGDWTEWHSDLRVRKMPKLQTNVSKTKSASPTVVRIDDGEPTPPSEIRRLAALKAWETRRARQSATQKE